MERKKLMTVSSLLSLFKIILSCLCLFFIFDIVSVFIVSVISYFEKNVFLFNWKDVFSAFYETGYIGGVILGLGVWIRVTIKSKGS